MIPPQREAEILRLYHAEKWPVGTIARQLAVHHNTVRRVLAQAGVVAPRCARPSMADPFAAFIVQTLTRYPTLRASRLFEMIRARGYPGRPDHFRSIVARMRPRPKAEAYLRLRTLPGEQAQVDWGHFGKLTVGKAERPLVAFVMVLSWSRQIFLRFFPSAAMPSFLRGHVDAFDTFGGVPRVLLYDNLKSAVLEREGDAIRFHPKLLELAAHYHFEPRPVAPARGNEKGRVERAIRYVRDAFFAARPFRDLDDLNAQASAWTDGLAGDRRWPEDRARTVRDAFADERGRLLTLPGDPFPADERTDVDIGKTPYARFDLNDYSLPATYVRRTLTLVASTSEVCILDGLDVVAAHVRSYDRGQQLEHPEHVRALVEQKRAGREHRSLDRLHHAAPRCQELLRIVADRGGNVGRTVWLLTQLLDSHTAQAVDAAIGEAIARDSPHVGAVRQALDRARQLTGEPPPVGLHLPADPRLDSIRARPHALSTYDQLRKADTDDQSD
ncbi:MAG: IS21 family transposase [Polyangiales bacterium]